MHTQPSQSSKTPAIQMPDFEEFEFKALSDGLGFHQPEEKPRYQARAQVRPQSQAPQSTGTSNLGLSKESLAAIYGQEALETTKPKAKTKKISKKLIHASMIERLSAQVIDTMIVTLAVATMFVAMVFAAGISLTQLKTLILLPDVMIVASVLWLFFYVSYFTILEMSQTPGKRAMRLKVVRVNGQEMSLSLSLERTVFRVLSWFALGFPLIMNFHGRLSGTNVVRK